ncbi:MAG: methyltransferase domain-containing protein [Phycisphaeraceae bacterium]|nr:methyltransferase domain-containing protein [Phycisphaeraceae bacterium]MCB9848710.1 methyltransferase domain-containing protein [Phycisphaeraceae bacterium]
MTTTDTTAGAALSKRRQKKNAEREERANAPKLAETTDRHVLYQSSVQDVESEIDFVDEQFEKIRGRKAKLLREDFCGTANTSCEWVRRRPTNRAISLDIDTTVLAWGEAHNVAALEPEARKRISLIAQDVFTARTEPVDALLAMNFSYWLFTKREDLRSYFQSVHRALKDDGILFLDAYGGWEAHQTCEESRECETDDGLEFDYIWEQVEFDPVTSHMKCAIHFEFLDGSRMDEAFTYQWRLWSLPELRELLEEAGFRKVRFFWEDADDDTGEGNGEFNEVSHAESDPGWICYIVAEK